MTNAYDPAALDALLDAALDLPPHERVAFVDRQAAGDPALREAALAILREAATPDDFLAPDSPPAVALRTVVLARDTDEEPALSPGDRFGGFEVAGSIGRGGMGEVYRARDPRLGREVALKVLPRAVSGDPLRLARFEREARMLGSLNHPNIGAIYGLAEDGGRQALVLEFVEGSTLASRIHGGPMPPADVVAIGRQVALALETAHARGIVHRDLKPSNIVVTPDGTVKVLDFGLAKAARRDGDDDASLTSSLAAGALMGTPSYMAPEQVQGTTVDQRADIWSFGCLLFEMLTGVRAFGGDSTGRILSDVLAREPDLTQLPPSTPEPLRRLLRRMLVKDPERRMSGIANARGTLDAMGRERPLVAGRWGLAAIAAGVLVVAAAAWLLIERPGDGPVVRFALPVAASDQLLPSGQQVAALSPDGRTVVYRAIRGGQVGLFVRTIGELDSRALPGTMHASGPFFSPDGAWIGFDDDGALRKVAVAGGDPVLLCEIPGGADASWGGDAIVFSTAVSRVLYRVAAAGGTPEPLTTLDASTGESGHAFPFVLRDGRAVLFTILSSDPPHIAALGLDDGGIRRIVEGSQPRLIGGFLAFVREGNLWAAPFDERRLTLTGEPRVMVEGLETAGGAAAHFTVAGDGTLVYAPRREEVPERAIVWVDESGAEQRLPIEPKRYARAALAPGGRRIALAASEAGNADIWVADGVTGALERLTREPTSETAPLWSPDGEVLVFRSDLDGGGLFRMRADGRGSLERLTAPTQAIHTPHGFTPDGRTLLYTAFRSYVEQAIEAVDLARPLVTRTLVDGPGAQLRPTVSPDGRWLAYQSDESGQFEIYVRPYPDVSRAAVQVSRDGGTSPRWSADGKILFYYDGRGVTAARLGGGAEFAVSELTRFFAYAPFSGRLGPEYDPSPDGSRFLFIRPASDTPSSRVQLIVVRNWLAELRASFR